MEDTQARYEQASQKCDELRVQSTRLQHDLDAEKSRHTEIESVTNKALDVVSELTTQLGVLKDDKKWWGSHDLISCFEYLRGSPHFSGLLDDLTTTTYETGRHDGMYVAYLGCNCQELLTEEFRAANAATSNRMAETLSAVDNDPPQNFNKS
ncbi:hypothetical protein Hanom_Chr00s000001g01597801 [Helianthus anomalus]